MTPFDGFPARMQFTRIPNVFFSRLLPRIDDIAELKVTLFVLARLYTKKGHPRFVTLAELADDPALGERLGTAAPAVLGKALEAAAMRGRRAPGHCGYTERPHRATGAQSQAHN